jgi:thymidylate synthase (FAD)
MTENSEKIIELAARTCYKSQDKITETSGKVMIKSLLNREHLAMIEFADATVRFITDRGVTHELVRHRLCSFAQESTRYVNYNRKEMQFICPVDFYDSWSVAQQHVWTQACEQAQQHYKFLIDSGLKPQDARAVLPNCIKTEIVVKANFREWLHIFKLRTSKQAHPQIRSLMLDCQQQFAQHCPTVFKTQNGD